jgi:hypothetical protein
VLLSVTPGGPATTNDEVNLLIGSLVGTVGIAALWWGRRGMLLVTLGVVTLIISAVIAVVVAAVVATVFVIVVLVAMVRLSVTVVTPIGSVVALVIEMVVVVAAIVPLLTVDFGTPSYEFNVNIFTYLIF